MRVTSEYPQIFAPNSAPTKRLKAILSSRFPEMDISERPNFDDRVRDVLREYALPTVNVDEVVAYLDRIGYGPIRVPSMLEEAIVNFTKPHVPCNSWNRNFKAAKDQVKAMLKPVAPLTVVEYAKTQDFYDILPKKEAHAGFIYLETGLKKKGDNVDRIAQEWAGLLEQVRLSGTFSYPILIGSRMQCSGGFEEGTGKRVPAKHKERAVCMIDERQIFAELMFSKAAQHNMHCSKYYAMGKAPKELHSIVTVLTNNRSSWTSIDYSGYDQSLPGWLIYEAFDIIHGWFHPIMMDKWEWLWKVIVKDFVSKRFLGRGGELVLASDGVPSGSMFTSIIDTICNMLIVCTYFHSRQVPTNQYSMCICGDDNIIAHDCDLDLEDFSGYINRVFGVTCHPTKCAVSGDYTYPQFLSREWRPNGVWRHPMVLIGKLCYPERFRNYQRYDLDPDLIVYCYILTYELGMRQLMDVDRFFRDKSKLGRSFASSVYAPHMPGVMSYAMMYEGMHL